jgi:hypothetical protein
VKRNIFLSNVPKIFGIISIISFLIAVWFSFQAGRVYLEPQAVTITNKPFGEKIHVNTANETKWAYSWPRLPGTNWGSQKEVFYLQDLFVINSVLLWTEQFRIISNSPPRHETILFVTGELRVKDWKQFFNITDPERRKEQFSPNTTRKDAIRIVLFQITTQEVSHPLLTVQEFRARVAFAQQTALRLVTEDPQKIFDSLATSQPWYFALGPNTFLQLAAGASKGLPTILPEVQRAILSADTYDAWAQTSKDAIIKFKKDAEDLLRQKNVVEEKAHLDGERISQEFLMTIGDDALRQRIFFEMTPQDFAKKADGFFEEYQKTHPDASYEYRGDGTNWVQFAYSKFVIIAYLNAQILIYEEIFEKQLTPFFVNLPEYKDPLNSSLWEYAIRTALLAIDKNGEDSAIVQEQLFLKWYQTHALKLLAQRIKEKGGVKDIFEFVPLNMQIVTFDRP